MNILMSSFVPDQNAVGTIQKRHKYLFYTSILCWCIMLIAQFIMLFRFNGDQISDAKGYLTLAENLVKISDWYPDISNLHSRYVFGNGFVNYLILILGITDNIKFAYFLNIVFCQIILFSSLYIVYKITNNKTALYTYLILFSLLNTFWSEVVTLRTEIPFTSLVFFAFALLYTNKKYAVPVSGIIIAIANWVRPLGIPALICALLILISRSKKISDYIKLVSSACVTVLIIGTLTFLNCGHFVYQSTTFGVNLIMSANDKADGSYMPVDDIIYITEEKAKSMTFDEYDKLYTTESIKWIIKNPIKYISQIPKKIFYLYATETYSGDSYFNNQKSTGGLDYIKSIVSKISGKSDDSFVFADFLICFNQIWYMIIFSLFLCGLIILFSDKYIRTKIAPYILFMAFGTAITIVVVGGARYHFPYLPIMIMMASYFFSKVLTKDDKNDISEIIES